LGETPGTAEALARAEESMATLRSVENLRFMAAGRGTVSEAAVEYVKG
jgi:hypothetical protein